MIGSKLEKSKRKWIQIQHLLKLNIVLPLSEKPEAYSNTTLVKVKSKYADKKSILVRLFKYNTC